jgi:predicted naringenin-chalcone synthase
VCEYVSDRPRTVCVYVCVCVCVCVCEREREREKSVFSTGLLSGGFRSIKAGEHL